MPYTVYIDGGSRGNPGSSAAGVQIVDSTGRVMFAGGLFLGHQTNNEAEYAGLLLALDLLHAADAAEVLIRSDSELLVRQMQGKYRVKAANLKPLYDRAAAAVRRLSACRFEHVLREENQDADRLVNQALDAKADVVPIDPGRLWNRLDRPAKTSRCAEKSGQQAEKSNRHADVAASNSLFAAAENTRAGRSTVENTSTGVIEVRVMKSPRSGAGVVAGASGCPAGIRAGQIFQFANVVPTGLCIHACAATIEAVVALRSIAAEMNVDADVDAGPLEPITATCSECGAIFQVQQR